MIVKSIMLKAVVSPILRGNIHGQGSHKRYVFLLVDGSDGLFFSEIYCGTYNWALLNRIVEIVNKEFQGKALDITDVINNTLHIPFISGGGVYQVIMSAFYNAILLSDLSWRHELPSVSALEIYLSGGTVKTSIDEMRSELRFAMESKFNLYKMRLDYRYPEICDERLRLLASTDLLYAVDLIVNTNHSERYDLDIGRVLARADLTKLAWLEEPVFPSAPSEWSEVLYFCEVNGIHVALGESLSSMLELEYLLVSPMISVIQIDATHCSDLYRLQTFQQRVASSDKQLGYHSWGSYITLFLNGLLSEAAQSGYFEVPFYETEFDRQVVSVLSCKPFDLAKPSSLSGSMEKIISSLARLINCQPEKNYRDFKWS